ncbi:hypothetical protein SISSUDRAFT_977772, partial [Sistotremastrum suecicum HHB10207 ss-3]
LSRVSSTLDKSVAKKHLIDGVSETCWTSTQGTPQWLQLKFPGPIRPRRLSITFQGGFVGRRCVIGKVQGDGQSRTWTTIYPEDVNRKQVFSLPALEPSEDDGVYGLKLTFEESSDFFGRITIYDLGLEGDVVPPTAPP